MIQDLDCIFARTQLCYELQALRIVYKLGHRICNEDGQENLYGRTCCGVNFRVLMVGHVDPDLPSQLVPFV